MSKRAFKQPCIEEPASSSAPTPISSEHLTLRVMSVMRDVYRSSPEALWGLSRSADALAPRRFLLDEGESFDIYRRRCSEKGGCPLISLRIKPRFNQLFTILSGIKEVQFDDGNYSYGGHVAGQDCLTGGSRFNFPLILPPGIEEVRFGVRFNQPISFPASLHKVVLGLRFNQPLKLGSGLKEIGFHHDSQFNQDLTLPSSVRKAGFGYSFDQPIAVPSSIEELRFAGRFGQFMDFQPLVNLQVLHIGGKVNHPIEVESLMKLRRLVLGADFNRPVALPSSIEEIYFGSSFSQPVDLVGCRNLRVVYLGHDYNRSIAFPDSVEKITLGECFNQLIKLPPNLREFDCYWGDFNKQLTLPPSGRLRTVCLTGRFNQPIDLVEGLEVVRFGDDFNWPITLPSTLKELIFSYDSTFNHPIELHPSGALEYISFGAAYTHSIPTGVDKISWCRNTSPDLPEGLKHAEFSLNFMQPLTLPDSLETISFADDSGYDLPLYLPPGCRRLGREPFESDSESDWYESGVDEGAAEEAGF